MLPHFSLFLRDAAPHDKAMQFQYSRRRSRASSGSGGRQPCKELEGLASAADSELQPIAQLAAFEYLSLELDCSSLYKSEIYFLQPVLRSLV